MKNKVKVYEVRAVHLTVYRSMPPKLLIEVAGIVPTTAYTGPELVEYVYVHPPPNGIYEFDFIAEPPAGASVEVLTNISARYLVDPMPRELKGVEVFASHNSKVASLREGISPTTICVKGTLRDEGVECQALRSTEGELYTLVGNLSGFTNGDEVVVCGTIAEISFCMQGTTINVSWIGSEAPRARR